MPLDPEAKALLDKMKASGARPRNTMTPQEVRTQALEALRANPPKLEPVAKVEDRKIPRLEGEVVIRIYWPEGDKPKPMIMYFHGGGWTLGSIETHDASCRTLTNLSRCIVISVDFRLAPENKFPAALEDCYAATVWASQNGESLGGDPNRIAVFGNSSGANLAAVVSLMARDKGGPTIAYQALLFPNTNYAFDTKSYIDNAEGYGLTRDESIWFWRNYLNNEEEGANPYASPLRAPDLSKLPPAIVLTAEYDPLRDEGAAYAERLKEAGVPTIYKCYEGMIHGFMRSNMMGQAKSALHDTAKVIKEHFAS